MLILTRRNGENVRIGDDIALTVLEVSGTHVRLGVTAPRSIPVHREEVFRRIAEKTETAPTSGSGPVAAVETVAGLATATPSRHRARISLKKTRSKPTG
jgi:carbon storage regulator